MKDAILKGTGDSRYLKSKIPTGTTWEQALAMLNAGTFPVDLNGINTEGFQQVGTPLNKANLLKDAVVSKLGMTGDKTPNDMFGVLADCGNLHVWRKTVTITEEVPAVPAGYTLEDLGTIRLYQVLGTLEYFFVRGTSSVSVSNDGVLSFTLESNYTKYYLRNTGDDYDFCNEIVNRAGQIVQFSTQDGYLAHLAEVARDTVLYISDGVSATYSQVDGYYGITISGLKKLVPYPYTPAIPAGTHVTYPVSTNRNAYQEGSDAKPAGYTLGDAEKIILGDYSSGTNQYIKYSDSVSVTDTGVVSLFNTSGTVHGNTLGESNNFTTLKGKFISTSRYGYDVIFFVPVSSTLTTAVIDGDTKFSADCQPVTGYPAIPAGTVIDYLGCLGDKARVQVLSYVGTGTYGVNNPISLTFRFKPKIVFVTNVGASYTTYMLLIPSALSATYTSYGYIRALYGSENLSDYYAKIEDMTVSYYSSNESGSQANALRVTYTVLAIG